MDKVIAADASWATVLQTGKDDLDHGIAIIDLKRGPDRIVVEVGCGLGRMSPALAEHFGKVVGLDVAPRLIKEARLLNVNNRISFEVTDGIHLRPRSIAKCDTVFLYEVLHYINPEALATYCRDAYELLAPGGEFVFQLNMEPIYLKTEFSFWLRRWLHACGIKHWRGWPTGAGLRRYYHSSDWLKTTLTGIGFEVKNIAGASRRQQWVLAHKT